MSGKVLVEEDDVLAKQYLGRASLLVRRSSGGQTLTGHSLSRAKFRVDHGLSRQSHGVAKSRRGGFLAGQSPGRVMSWLEKVLAG